MTKSRGYIKDYSYDLAKSTYGPIYDYCNNSTSPYTPPNPPTNDSVIPTGKVIFSAAAGTKFGFDGWKEANAADKINYLSIAAGCSTFVTVKLSGNLSKAYGKVIAVLPTASADGVSFTNIGTTDTLVLTDSANTDSVNNVPIYAKNNANLKTPIKMNIYGIDDPAKPVCLAGDGLGSEDKVYIVAYNEKKYDLNLYFINDPTYKPTDSVFKEKTNYYLKQAVTSINNIARKSYPYSSWDNNINNTLESFPIDDSVPTGWQESLGLMDSLQNKFNDGPYWGNPDSEQTPRVIILPGKIRECWLLMENATSGSDTVVIQYDKNFTIFRKDLKIADWDGSNTETIQVNNILLEDPQTDTTKNRLAIKIYATKLRSAHNRHSILYIEDRSPGFTLLTTSCSFISTGLTSPENYSAIVHEILHMARLGSLSHTTEDITNIMYPFVGNGRNYLRYRSLKTDDLNNRGIYETQWNILQK